jgi:hypothetical protein
VRLRFYGTRITNTEPKALLYISKSLIQFRTLAVFVNLLDLPVRPQNFGTLNPQKRNALIISHHHHQPINVPTAGAQAFLMDYT